MRSTFLFALLTFVSVQMSAQEESPVKDIFNHLGIGVSVGTDGIGFDLAAPVTSYAAIRGGVSFWPKVAISKDIHIKDNNPTIADEVTLEGKPNIFDFKLLADFYPSKTGSFHITAGLYVGKSAFLTATNTTQFIKDPSKYGKLGLIVGDYRIETDQTGHISAEAKASSVKPYLGIGFGRAVPKGRIGVTCDFGVQFWGRPAAYAWTVNDWGDRLYHKFSVDDLDQYDDKAIKDALDVIDKICVFPVLNIRLTGRIF
jgi:hypothetical protein